MCINKNKRLGEPLSPSSVNEITYTSNNVTRNRELSIIHMTADLPEFQRKGACVLVQ